MANYITTLREENASIKAQVQAMEAAIRSFRAYLESPKFCGDDKDWISTGDVSRWLAAVVSEGNEAFNGWISTDAEGVAL